ncbi:WD repeat-containing protein 70-like isoform X4 [Amphibalanus amphitrite]|uniref:WD repeat-containing protein 70-like isoform X2 n=1 Tax=Amphibalanus amphitrite TaxID=1232801 RepID=UPI001C8FDECF|nr:WD repeat-containing protein 70-like isoform X2 [Amphibalanus amphitrite]XP_043189544.1 WD repeat-containing protein 70-like isoform X4 [Amphibalanus amphitrite]
MIFVTVQDKMKKISFGKISFASAGTSKKDSNTADQKSNNSEDAEAPQGFGSFGKKDVADDKVKGDEQSMDEESNEMAKVMGFGSFGGKKAKQFDINTVLKDTLETAVQRNKDNIEKMTEMSSSEDQSGTAEEASGSKQDDAEESDDEELIGPPLPPATAEKTADDAADDDEDADSDVSDDDEDDDDPRGWIPVSTDMSLEHGSKPVTALTADPAGSRVVTGALDYVVKYWDFNGMDLSRRSFRDMRPFESNPITSAQYSSTGDRVLATSGSAKVKVFDRDGVELCETLRGDMYLVDMKRTKGHVAGVSGAAWHPKIKEEFLTCASDGTCRIWHVDDAAKSQRHVVKPRAMGGLKTHPSACTYSRDGHLVAAACTDGSLQMWDHRKAYVSTTMLVRDGHQRGTETSSIVFSYDNVSVATRGGDETLKLWDVRQFRKPVHTAAGLFNKFPMTDCLFSPNDQLVVTGTSLERGETLGQLHFFLRSTFEKVAQLPVAEGHVIRAVWHPRINQLLLGCGSGVCKVLYDPDKSHRGALLCAGKKKSKSKQMDVVMNTQVITPHALPMFREPRARSTHKQAEKARQDPKKSRRPDLPQGKSGTGGRVAVGGSTMASYIMRTLGVEAKKREEGDPREALLKHAKEAAENPYWVTPAYAKTQPKQIFQPVENSDEPDSKKRKT